MASDPPWLSQPRGRRVWCYALLLRMQRKPLSPTSQEVTNLRTLRLGAPYRSPWATEFAGFARTGFRITAPDSSRTPTTPTQYRLKIMTTRSQQVQLKMESSFLSGVYKRYGDLEGGNIVIFFQEQLGVRWTLIFAVEIILQSVWHVL